MAILDEARIDIPPLLRGQVWSALLGVSNQNCQQIFDVIDKDSETATDKQLDLDIPRCHQYQPLMSSKDGKTKLRRILKCWVEANKGKLVYWQGMLCVCVCVCVCVCLCVAPHF
jgi:TBC domain-containing protein kinase-like protein